MPDDAPDNTPPEVASRRNWWLKLLGIVVGALTTVSTVGVTWWQLIKGEPQAKQTQAYISKDVKAKLHALDQQLHTLHLRVVQLQAAQECSTSMRLYEEKFKLQQQVDELQRQLRERPQPGATVAVVGCPTGQLLVDGKCTWVPKAVAASVKATVAAGAASDLALQAERVKRKQAEQGKATLKQQLINKAAPLPAPMQLAPWEK